MRQPTATDDRSHADPVSGYDCHRAEIGDARAQSAPVIDGDRQHAGYGSRKSDGPVARGEHRTLARRCKVGTMVTRVPPLGAIWGHHRSGHGSPQTKRQQQPGHHPSFGQPRSKVSEIGSAGKGFDRP